MRLGTAFALVGGLFLLCPAAALAGMPMPHLTERAVLQLSTISFFLAALLVSAGVICGLWNWLRRDFPRLPQLSYLRAVGMTVLWGLLFLVVLTMIAGARELLTPGAWERHGFLYELSNVDDRPNASAAAIAQADPTDDVAQKLGKERQP